MSLRPNPKGITFLISDGMAPPFKRGVRFKEPYPPLEGGHPMSNVTVIGIDLAKKKNIRLRRGDDQVLIRKRSFSTR